MNMDDDAPANESHGQRPSAHALEAGPKLPPDFAAQFESALQESAERYTSLFENHHAIMLLYDPVTFNIIDANPAACQFYGYDRRQLTTMKMTDLNGLSLEEAAEALRRAWQTDRQPYLLKHRLANGEIRDVESYAEPIQIRGKIYQYSIVHDITRRKQAEEELQRERNFVSAVLDIVGALVVVLDREGRIVRFNRACERTTGYTFDEVRNHCFWDLLLLPEEIEPVKDVFEKLRAGNYPCEFENHWVTKEGRRRLIAWSNTALAADDGTVEYVIGTGLDVTEQRQAEREIRHISSFLLLNPNPVLEVDTAGELIFSNPGSLATLQRLGAESDARLFLPADLPAIIQDLLQRRMSAARREVEINGAIFAESLYLAPSFGTIPIFANDITARKKMEEELRQFNQELQARNVDLDAFAHTVAHDIKNPLHLIIGYAEVLAEYGATLPAETVATSLQAIVQSAHRINRITDDLLLLSEVRQKDVAVAPLDMAAIVAEARQRLVNTIKDEIEIKVPAASAWPIALGYAPWIEEVWVNYLANAFKYGGRPPCIELGGEPQANGMARFWIRDNGIGIVPENQAHVFRTFYRVSGKGGGYGLGLSIVKRIVEKLGGEVDVQSSGVPGEGSVFSFTLPAA
jgi:PAS domain S-box-containing protein